MRLLFVEDERRLASALVQLCREHHYTVDVAYDGESGLDLALTNSYDAIILDIMLPKLNGLDILKAVRKEQLDVPVLLLTARDTIADKVTGLDLGADDYLAKPFANEELLARIRALTRRTGNLAGTECLQAGPFSLDLSAREISRDGEVLSLTAKEFQLMELLMRNQGKVLSKEVILDRVWGPDADVIANAVENYIYFLRKKIDISNSPSFIETVRGVGYCFKVPALSDQRG